MNLLTASLILAILAYASANQIPKNFQNDLLINQNFENLSNSTANIAGDDDDETASLLPKAILISIKRSVRHDENALKRPIVSHYATIGIGTPPKQFKVVFDTGVSETWVPYYTINPFASNLHYAYGYDAKISNTSYLESASSVWTTFRQAQFQVWTYSDAFYLYGRGWRFDDKPKPFLSDIVAFRQKFAAVTDTYGDHSGDYKYRFEDGYVGLAPVARSTTGSDYLLINLQAEQMRRLNELRMKQQEKDPSGNVPFYDESRYIADQVFSFWFNPDLSSDIAGELSIGQIDTRRFVPPINFHKLDEINYTNWQITMRTVLMNNSQISCRNGCNANFDTGINSIIGPGADVQEIYNTIGTQYHSASDLHLVDCNRVDEFPTLSFVFGNHNAAYPYLITPRHYIREAIFRGQSYCYVGIRQWNKLDWSLGINFISAYYTVFDFKNRAIGFATPTQ